MEREEFGVKSNKTVPLNEFITFQRGFDLPAKDRTEGSIPIVASTNIVGYHNEAKAKAPGVIIGRSGSIGGGQYIKEDYWPLNTTLWVKDFKGHNPRYIYYVLKNIDFSRFNVGSGVPTLNRNHLSSINVEDIGIIKEEKIAHILSTLDDKIELNRKMNQTLEAMAQALFKSWFVDFDPVHAKAEAKSEAELEAKAAELGISKEVLELFPSRFVESEMGMIPEGWEVKNIKDLGRVVTGKTPPKKIEDAYSDKGKPFITPTDIDNSLFITKTVRNLSDSGQLAVKNSKITAGSICVTCIGSQMGKTTVAPTDSFTNQQINSIVLTKDNIRNYLLCNLRGRRKEIFLLGSGGGSTMPLLNKSSFEKINVLLPTTVVLEAFDTIIKDNIKLVLQNDIESNNLSKTRDTLLPKLLSGELDVSELGDI